MRVRSVEQSAQKFVQNALRSVEDGTRVEGCIRAFLDGKQPLNWVVRMIQDGDLLTAAQIFARLRGYGSAERYEELARWFDSELAPAK